MKQSNIPMIIISVIAFAVLLAVIGGSVFLIAYHIKYKEAPLSPAMPVKTQEKKDTAETAAENVDTTAEDQSTPTGENNETTAQEPPEEERGGRWEGRGWLTGTLMTLTRI